MEAGGETRMIYIDQLISISSDRPIWQFHWGPTKMLIPSVGKGVTKEY